MKTKTAVAVWLSVAGLCLAAAGTARGASGALPAPPAGWGDCDVLDYVAEGGGGPAARGAAPAGGTVERWLVRDAAAGTRYALERRSDGGRGMSVCAYSPNRVLATLRPGNSYEAFAAELAAKGMRIVRQLMEDLDGNPVYLIEAEDTESDVVDQMTMGIEETGVCSQVKPDHIFSASVVPNDQNYGLQWGLEKIGATEAWETRTDASSVLVAVLDTGINHDHFDLNRNLWLNEADLPGDGVDDDGNGIVDDTFGVSCLDGNLDGNTADDNGHGTHCAGIIGAEGNNRRLVAGVAWRAKIMALKFLNKSGRGSTSDAITCLRYAQEHGVRIVNCSFGSTDWDDYLYAQMLKMGQAGVVFVCAAGNAEPGERAWDNDVRPFHPSNFEVDNLVAVAASDRNDNLANFSFYGKEKVDIAAPGVEIYSTVEGGSGAVGYKSGTSMATPYVAGALALLMAEYPDETPDRIVGRLYAAAEPVEALAGKVRTGARLSLAGLFGIAPPADLSATQGTVQDAVVLYWQAAKEGTHYRVWRADSERGEKTMLCDWSRGLTFSDTDAAPGVTNWYFVQAARSADGDRASSFSAGVTGFRPPVDTTRVTVEFDPAGGTVSQERVRYLIGEPYGEFPAASFAGMAFLGWFTAAEGGVRMGETSLADAETTRLHAHWIDENIPRVANLFARQRYPWNGFVDVSLDLAGVPSGEFASVALSGTGADGGTTVPVRTFASGSFASLANGPHLAVWNAEADAPAGLCADFALSATVAVDIPPAPASGTASNNPAAGAIDLSWKAAKGASSYALSRGTSATQSAAEPLAAVTARTYRDTTAAAGAEYHYWIQSVSSGGTSAKALHLSARRGLVPTALAISGPDAVDAGTTADYSCTATLSDGSALAVTPAWSITAGAAFADSIGTRGTLTAARTATPGTVTLRAEWSTNGVSASATMDVSVRAVSVTVAFDAHGGTADPASHAYTAYGAYGTLSTATRTGYTFADWYTAASGGTEVAADSTVLPSVTTLHAHWTANTYTVRFDANGGSGTMADQAMTYDQSAALRTNAFARTGYTFAGWAKSSSGSVLYTDGGSVTNLATEQDAVVNLYAVWTPNSYTVSYYGYGENPEGPRSLTATYDTPFRLVVPTNIVYGTNNIGQLFKGWIVAVGGDTNTAFYGTSSTNITEPVRNNWMTCGDWTCESIYFLNLTPTNNGNVSLHTQWTHCWRLPLDWQGGTGGDTNVEVKPDMPMPEIIPPTRKGYAFAGYFTEAGGNGEQYYNAAGTPVGTWNSSKSFTLYAAWTPNTYTVAWPLPKEEEPAGGRSLTATYDVPFCIQSPATSYYYNSNNVACRFSGWFAMSGLDKSTAKYGESAANVTKRLDGSAPAEPGQSVWFVNLTPKAGGSVVFASTWTEFEQWLLPLDWQGGTGGSESAEVRRNETPPAIIPPTRQGYMFAGYYTEPGGGGTQYYKADGTGARTWNLSKSVTLYAAWTWNAAAFAAAADAPSLSFTTGGDADWMVVTNPVHTGSSALRSGSITNSESTWLQTTVAGTGQLSFWYWTSSEASCDKLLVTIDGVQKGNLSGVAGGWNQWGYDVTNSGTHTVRWTYSKDSSLFRGEDCCWVDGITWTPETKPDLAFKPATGWTEAVFLAATNGAVAGETVFQQGAPIYLYCSFANIGTAAVTSNYTIVHRVLDSGGTVVSSYAIDATNDLYKIAAGQTLVWNGNTAFIPSTLGVGSYTYRCILDEGGTLDELTEGNNIADVAFAVENPGAALREATDAPGALTFTTGGDAPWTVVTGASYLNGSSARSGSIANGGTSWMQAVLPGAGTVSFRFQVSCGSGDKLQLYTDGVAGASFSDDVKNLAGGWNWTLDGESWTKLSFTFTNSGTHTLRWAFEKDSSGASGQDCCWVDAVAWEGAAPTWTTNASGILTGVTINGATDVAIPDGVKGIAMYAFKESGITSVKFPDSLASVGSYAFHSCTALTNVTFGGGLKFLDSWAFYGCTGLKGVFEVPSGVTNIEFGAFMRTGVETLVLPASLKKLGAQQTVWTPLERVYFRGNAPELTENQNQSYPNESSPYCDAPESLVTYVPVGSTGWKDSGSVLPDTWPVCVPRSIRHYTGNPPSGTSGVARR